MVRHSWVVYYYEWFVRAIMQCLEHHTSQKSHTTTLLHSVNEHPQPNDIVDSSRVGLLARADSRRQKHAKCQNKTCINSKNVYLYYLVLMYLPTMFVLTHYILSTYFGDHWAIALPKVPVTTGVITI